MTLHVLVVDDSAVMRQAVSAILRHEPGMSVTVASDPLIAMRRMAMQRPDVIMLDIEMPHMDGLTFLQKIMAEDPIPVVICSAVSPPQSGPAVRALEHGAVDIVLKPRIGLRDFLEESRVLLVDALRAAAKARLRRRPASTPRTAPSSCAPVVSPATSSRHVVAIGASTGGTEALLHLFAELPSSSPGIVVVQHMPEVFTAHFAKRLNQASAMDVSEAKDGDRLEPGRAFIAPGNRHMHLRSDGNGFFVNITDGPLVSRHRPSVDVLFSSVATAAGADAIGILLTGMGTDGAAGMAEMKQRGARTIAQDEATSVVFGMPREAILRGLVDDVLPLSAIGAAIARYSAKGSEGAPGIQASRVRG